MLFPFAFMMRSTGLAPVSILYVFTWDHVQGLVTLLKKRIQIQKDHLKAMQKLSQSVHDDHQLRQVKFEG